MFRVKNNIIACKYMIFCNKRHYCTIDIAVYIIIVSGLRIIYLSFFISRFFLLFVSFLDFIKLPKLNLFF